MQFLLKLHRRCQRWRRQYHQDSGQVRTVRCAPLLHLNLSGVPLQLQRYRYISVGLFLAEDPYPSCRPTAPEVERLLCRAGQGGRRRAAAKTNDVSSAKRPRHKQAKQEAEQSEEDWRPKVGGSPSSAWVPVQRLRPCVQSEGAPEPREEDQQKKLWQFIAKKEIPKVWCSVGFAVPAPCVMLPPFGVGSCRQPRCWQWLATWHSALPRR